MQETIQSRKIKVAVLTLIQWTTFLWLIIAVSVIKDATSAQNALFAGLISVTVSVWLLKLLPAIKAFKDNQITELSQANAVIFQWSMVFGDPISSVATFFVK